MMNMVFDCVGRDVKTICNLLVAEPFLDQAEYFLFAQSEAFLRRGARILAPPANGLDHQLCDPSGTWSAVSAEHLQDCNKIIQASAAPNVTTTAFFDN